MVKKCCATIERQAFVVHPVLGDEITGSAPPAGVLSDRHSYIAETVQSLDAQKTTLFALLGAMPEASLGHLLACTLCLFEHAIDGDLARLVWRMKRLLLRFDE